MPQKVPIQQFKMKWKFIAQYTHKKKKNTDIRIIYKKKN